MTVRALGPADAAAYRVLRLRSLAESPEAFSRSEAESEAVLAERFANVENAFTLGAFAEGGELAGFVSFTRERGEKVAHKGFLTGMYVAPAWRGRGLGRRLCEELVGRVRALAGLEQLALGVAVTSGPARALYLSLGFAPYGVEPRALRVGGEYIDEELMVLMLDAGHR